MNGIRYHANAGRIDVQAINSALFHDLRIARNNSHTGFLGHARHRFQHRFQGRNGQAFFQDKATA